MVKNYFLREKNIIYYDIYLLIKLNEKKINYCTHFDVLKIESLKISQCNDLGHLQEMAWILKLLRCWKLNHSKIIIIQISLGIIATMWNRLMNILLSILGELLTH